MNLSRFPLRRLAAALLFAALAPTVTAAPEVQIEPAWRYEHRSAADGDRFPLGFPGPERLDDRGVVDSLALAPGELTLTTGPVVTRA